MGLKVIKDIASFLGLADTPASFPAGSAMDKVIVNDTVDGIKFGSPAIHSDGTALPTADIPMGGFKVTNVSSPVNSNDVANKLYADESVDTLTAFTPWREYADNISYVKGEIITERGTIYKVTTDIGATSRRNAPYGSLDALNLGVGTAFYQSIPHNGNQWVRIAYIPVYTSGDLFVGGLFNGQQADFTFKFNMGYSTSSWTIRLTQHNGTLIQQISLRQSAVNQPLQIWVKVATTSGLNWDMHMICKASGGHAGTQRVLVDQEITMSSSVGGVGGHLWDIFPGTGNDFVFNTS